MGWTATTAKAGVGAMGAAILLGLQVPPDTAQANAAKWIGLVSGHVPNWPHSIDNWLTIPALLLTLTPLWWWLWKRYKRAPPNCAAEILKEERMWDRSLSSFSIHRSLGSRYWQEVDDYTLWQAAYLWCDYIPPNTLGEMPPKVGAQLHRLKRAVGRGEITTLETGPTNEHALFWLARRWIHSGAEAIVSRSELQKYASSIRARPEFLTG